MEKLSDIKKELALLDKAQLMALCTRMAKLKKENKEFLSYLISDADDPQFYAEKLKAELDVVWKEPFYSVWALNKSLCCIFNRVFSTTGSMDLTIVGLKA